MRRIRRIWQNIRQGEKIDVYLTLLAAITIAGLNAFGVVDDSWLAPLTLAALGILAAAMLGNRHRIENLLNEIGSSRTPPLRMRTELSPLPSRAADASDILIVALSGAEVLRYTEFFVDKLRQGASVRLAIANPESDAIADTVSPLTGISKDAFIADMQAAKGLVQLVREKAPDSRQFKVKFFDYAPTLSFAMIDGDKPTGQIIAEMRPYGISSSLRCHLFVTAKDYPTWYMYFHDVCEAVWRDSDSSEE